MNSSKTSTRSAARDHLIGKIMLVVVACLRASKALQLWPTLKSKGRLMIRKIRVIMVFLIGCESRTVRLMTTVSH